MGVEIEITYSPRRRRTMSARLVGGRLQVRVPSDTGDDAARRFAESALRRIERAARRRELNHTTCLLERAQELSQRYFGGRLVPSSVEYVSNQAQRFGSCSVGTRRIRLSDRLATVPAWVRDYVLIHELAHLEAPNHSPAFWRLVRRYRWVERARGYLMAIGLEPAVTTDPPGADDVET
jgi:predicted metal-dependent hydrolase